MSEPSKDAHPSREALERYEFDAQALGPLRDQIEAHVAGCAECVAWLHGMHGFDSELAVRATWDVLHDRRTNPRRTLWERVLRFMQPR